MLKFTEMVRLKQGDDLIMTYYGINGFGLPFFAYIRCNEAQLKKIRADEVSGDTRNINEYGEVIYREYGTETDEAAKKFLAEYIEQNGGSLAN